MQCFVIDGGGALVASSADPCLGFAVLTTSEYAAVVGLASELPTAPQMGTAWSIGFFLVCGCYVLGRSVGAVLDMLR